MRRSRTPFLPFVVAAFLAACGGGGGGGSGTGTLNVSVTDAPIDGATHVVVRFTGLELQRPGGDRLDFDFETPRNVDLLALQGNASEPLLEDTEIPAGRYNWIRLKVDTAPGTLNSYIEFEDGTQAPLYVPSGDTHGLQLSSGFTVAQGSIADFVIDFNLRKSVHEPQNAEPDYFLRPSLRMVDRLEVGSISGTVPEGFVTDSSCTNGSEHDTGNAVYVYAGPGVTPDDVGSPTEPITSALVVHNETTGDYEYTIGFLAEGEYTVAFTCQGAGDNPETDDDVAFRDAADVSVTAGEETVHDF